MSQEESPDQLAAASPSGKGDASPTTDNNLLQWLVTLQSELVALNEILVEHGLTSRKELEVRVARVREEMFPSIPKEG